MLFTVSCRHIPVKASGLSDKSKHRISTLKSNCTKIEKKLDENISLALVTCNSSRSIQHPSNTYCSVLWDEIEELSNTIHDMKNEIKCLEDEDDYDCWDPIECKMYDV